MPSKVVINPVCPLCKGDVYFPKKGDHPNAEYVQTKRGLKQLFHTKCYDAMIKERRSWYD